MSELEGQAAPPRRKAVWIAAGALVLAAAVGVGVWAQRGAPAPVASPPPPPTDGDALDLPASATAGMRPVVDVSDLLAKDPVVTDALARWRSRRPVSDAALARAFVALEAAYFLRDHAVAMRPGAFAPYVTTLFARLEAAARPALDGEPGADPQAAHVAGARAMGELKARLLARWGTRYEAEHDYLFDFVVDGFVQCRSGTYLTLLGWLLTPHAAGSRPVIVYTPGHVQPGLVAQGRASVVEATQRGGVVKTRPFAQLSPVRVVDARLAMQAQIRAAAEDPGAIAVGKRSVIFDHGEAPAMADIAAPSAGMRQDAASEPWAFGTRAKPQGERPLAPPPMRDPHPGRDVSALERAALAAQQCGPSDGFSCVTLALTLAETRLGSAAEIADALRRGCEVGVAEGCARLARRLEALPEAARRRLAGRLGLQTPLRASALLDRGCQDGWMPACRWLAKGQPDALRDRLLDRACTGKDTAACVTRCERVTAGASEQVDLKGPIAACDRGCAQGAPQACTLMGHVYARGLIAGQERDDEAAAALYRRACEKGGDCHALGLANLAGEGTAKRPRRGLHLLRMACASLDIAACGDLQERLAERCAKGMVSACVQRGAQLADASRLFPGVPLAESPVWQAWGEAAARACAGDTTDDRERCAWWQLRKLRGEGARSGAAAAAKRLRKRCAGRDKAACAALAAAAKRAPTVASAPRAATAGSTGATPSWRAGVGRSGVVRSPAAALAHREALAAASEALARRAAGERGGQGARRPRARKAPRGAQDDAPASPFDIAALQAKAQANCAKGGVAWCVRLAVSLLGDVTALPTADGGRLSVEAALLAPRPTPGDRARAWRLLRLGCDAGDDDACSVLASERAAELGPFAGVLHLRACEAGVVRSCAELGACYLRLGCGRGEGEPVGQHAALALPWLERACGAGDSGGCVRLAGLLRTGGRGVPAAPKRAAALLQTACKSGAGAACRAQAALLWPALAARPTTAGSAGAPAAPKAALALLERACGLGDLSSCVTWARAQPGEGLSRRAERRVREALQRACLGEEASACVLLGDRVGRGPGANPGLAAQLHAAACRTGDAQACARLGARWIAAGLPAAARVPGVRALRVACAARLGASCAGLARAYREGVGVMRAPKAADFIAARGARPAQGARP